ncbi:DUF885 family protein [Luteolibacter marinus]|uniref:DUF885 family protein n=1 Tax=Luteolibacter marinus TaxID=2776705 RepID=UPI001D02477F|nr:DUF885 family protein [Luteolibacter marinus]
MKPLPVRAAAFIILCLNLQAAGAQENSAPAAGMPGMIERFSQDRGALERLYAVEMSPARRDRLRNFHDQTLEELAAIDFGSLGSSGRIDWILLRNHLLFEQDQLAADAAKSAEITGLLPFAETIIRLEEDRRLLRHQEPRESARLVAAIPGQIDAIREDLEKQLKAGKAPGAVIGQRAARTVDQLRGALRNWNRFYSDYHPAFTWWLQDPYAKADQSLEDYAWFLREKLAGYKKGEDPPVIGDPIGREALIHHLRAAMIPYTPEELLDIAGREFAWCEAEMKRAADDLGFNGDWSKALEHVSGKHVEPGEQPALIKQLADESIAFVEEHDLVTVPDLAKETWRMEMMTPELQKQTPFFTGGEVISVAYPTSTMSHEDKLMGMRGNNIHFSRAAVHHELIPGHHLQLYMARRYNTHRSLFRTPFLIEGWALHWEMLLWDLDFQRSAEDRVGMLFWRSHRCARIIFSLRYHLGDMTAREAIDYLVERVGHERRNATAEVRRTLEGSYGPLYQAAYMLGGLQLRALHRDLAGSGKMSDKAFHDAVLLENAIPIEMIRASLSSQELEKDFATNWRFYEP